MTMKPDFETLFRASPYPYLVLARDLTIIGANDAYLRSVGRSEAELLGRYVFEAFPSDPADPDSVNIAEVKASMETAIATGRPNTTTFLRYAVPKPDGSFDERYWSTIHTPVFGPDGDVAFVFQNAIDVTHLYKFDRESKTASMELTSDAAQDKENFSRAQMHEAMRRILNDERGHLRNLFNHTPGFVAILSGPRLVFEMVNEAYYQLVGHRDILGKPVWEALPEVAGQGFEEILERVYNTGEPWTGRGIKVVLQREANGPYTERYVDLIYKPYHAEDGTVLGIFAQGHDVTDVFEAQAARRDSEQRLREGMVAAKMVVWDWEVDTRRIFFSDNVLDVLGGAPETIDRVYDFIHPEDRARMSAVHQRAIAERKGYRETLRFYRPDNGRMIWLDVHGSVRCDAAGKAFAIRGVTVDISERVAAEEELRNADRRKDEFLAMLAHELRNPLAPISSAAQLMKLAPLDENRLKQTSDVIMRQIGHMTGLVDDLIDVSRVTRGLIVVDRQKLDVKRIVSDAIEQTSPAIESKRHRLCVELVPDEVYVFGDKKRLVQVLANILHNAAKYTPAGGSIELRMDVRPDQVAITVSDDGIGISADLLPRVFELFTQGERTSDRAQGGLGLGLALVKSLVELHGGKVEAASRGANKGSRFSITLPRLASAGEFTDGQGMSVPSPPKHSLRVMIVDDNADAANMLAMFLETSGHEVTIAHSAHDALARLGAATPDVFLLDIGLPEMDGNELARRLRAMPQTARAVLVAVTGYGQEPDREKARAAGFDHHFVKPADGAKLAALLADVKPRLEA
ncbi:MAG: PAS domain-containing protein [Gammaproteobacteria bacterium]